MRIKRNSPLSGTPVTVTTALRGRRGRRMQCAEEEYCECTQFWSTSDRERHGAGAGKTDVLGAMPPWAALVQRILSLRV